jgi:diaminohydroxyphosphoribosylaminopyrimidine deaminase/5-amino-6-(5-phosphoribosylamino)uracil reductase
MGATADIDYRHLARAIDLAESGRGRVSPNPMVGAVITRDEQVLGEGFHGSLGGPHAEVEAILAASDHDLSGATLYVSLEPCCHQGRTPPCTEAIRSAGIGRVEVAIADGELAMRARLLNQPFRKHARTGRPWVLFKSAMTLDGKVATRSGDSKWISGEDSRQLAHHWRAECDAVVVGIGTALADDPQLTARVDGVARQPRRVVFDSLARLPLRSKLVADARRIPVTVVVSRAARRSATDALEAHGVEVIVAPGENEPARVRSALDQLGASGVGSILLEGGPHLGGAFFDAEEVDEIRLFLAPIVLGGRTARDPLEGEGAELIADAHRALTLTCERVGEDLLVSARMKDW